MPLVSLTLVVHLQLQLSPQILKKFETALMVYSGLGGNRYMPEVENLMALSLSNEDKTWKIYDSWDVAWRPLYFHILALFCQAVCGKGVCWRPQIYPKSRILIKSLNLKFSQKNQNGPDGKLKGLRQTDSWKNLKSRGTVPLKRGKNLKDLCWDMVGLTLYFPILTDFCQAKKHLLYFNTSIPWKTPE